MPEGTQEQTSAEVTIPADPASYDREGLESNVHDKMSDIFKDDDEVLVDAPAPDKGDKEVDAPPAKEKTEESETEETPAAAEKKAETPATPNPAAAVLPAAYRRSLKAYDWTDAEIDAALQANPDGFMKSAEKMHRSRVQETQRWAEIGKTSKQSAKPADEKKAPAFQPIDVVALRAKYGDEAFITELEKQNSAIAYLQNEAMPFIQASRERQAAAELETLTKQVDGYFGGKEMEPYHDHYGKSGQTLTDVQLAARQKVLETADLLISGARSMGRPITLDEALTMAHDSVSSPVAAKAAVKKIEQQVRTRQQAISLRPGARATTPVAGRKELESKVATGLAAAFK